MAKAHRSGDGQLDFPLPLDSGRPQQECEQVNDPQSNQQAPSFLSTPFFRNLSSQSFEKHAATPDISSDTHFALKHRELQSALAGKKLLYLDTNHWINLRHVVLNSPMERPGYRAILGLLQKLQNDGRVCCPFSFLLFLELMKQSDPNTRIHTARIMDQLSDGVCFQFPLEMARLELRQHVMKSLPGIKSSNLGAWVWTKVGFLGGELIPTITVLPEKTNWLIQKAWIDLMWVVRLEQMLSSLDSFSHAEDFWERYAAASNADAVFYRSSKLPYEEVLQREKALLIRKLIADELQPICQEMWDVFPQCRDVSNLHRLPEADYSPWVLPSLQICAGINAADMLSTMKFDAHDLLDFQHAAMAIPYCDALFCDNPLATRLRNKPCQFGQIYGKTILGNAQEIFEFLTQLSR